MNKPNNSPVPYIKSQIVIDRYGNKIADHPSEVPLLVARCRALSLYFETRDNYSVDRSLFDEQGFLIDSPKKSAI